MCLVDGYTPRSWVRRASAGRALWWRACAAAARAAASCRPTAAPGAPPRHLAGTHITSCSGPPGCVPPCPTSVPTGRMRYAKYASQQTINLPMYNIFNQYNVQKHIRNPPTDFLDVKLSDLILRATLYGLFGYCQTYFPQWMLKYHTIIWLL